MRVVLFKEIRLLQSSNLEVYVDGRFVIRFVNYMDNDEMNDGLYKGFGVKMFKYVGDDTRLIGGIKNGETIKSPNGEEFKVEKQIEDLT